MCCALPSNSRLESTPMQHYTHLSPEERYTIQAERRRSASVYSIARLLNRKPSTIYRELQRNTGLRGYRPKQAQAKADARRATHLSSLSSFAWSFIKHLLLMQWSPEQISYALKANGWDGVPSHEWIYQYVADDKRNKGKLYKHLRQGRKRYRKGKRTKGPAIKNAVSIDERPAIIDTRERFGDWEIDTVLGKHGTGAIVTILERKSRLYLAMKVDSKSAEDVTRATIALLMPYKEHVHTITADNGREFANHEEIAKVLDAKVYFAHPYSSWERGANENANGLLRQYVPKGTDLRLVSNELVALALSRINYRPKKCLGFKQPAKVFEEMRLAA